MKRINIFCRLLLATLVIVISSCSDDLGVNTGKRDIKEGIPVSVPLIFEIEGSQQVSRAAESDETEKTVNYLYIVAFNHDGSLDNQAYINVNNVSGSGQVDFQMTTGSDKRIYAIGNPISGSGSLTQDYLNTIKTENDLLNAMSKLRNSFLITRSYFLMSGKMEPDSPDGTIDVDIQNNTGVIYGATNPCITLQRVDARITFKVKGENTNNYTDFSFVPDRYWVCNIPQATYVFPKDEDYKGGYASMTYDNSINFEGEDESGYNIFEFYLPENRLQPKKRITENKVTKADGTSYEADNMYALRELQEKTPLNPDPNKPGQTEKNGEFVYANPNSTYVMFHGTLSYTKTENGSPKFVNADVTFTVHLGNTGDASKANEVGDESDPTDICVNNYRTERNTHYTYTVKVTDINSLVVEVKESKETRPGMEGDVIIAGAEIASMDSHYGREKFELTRKAIKDGLSWAISTQFQQGMKVFVAGDHQNDNGEIAEDGFSPDRLSKLQTDINLNDYKWVQFAINREAKRGGVYVPVDQFVKYPGYMAYCQSNQEKAAPAFNRTTYNGGYYDEPVTLYDVNQLLNHLYVEAHNSSSNLFLKNGKVSSDDDATVTFTAFIDEYVYKYDPRESFYEIPDEVIDPEQLKLWKEVVNGKNRMLHFCTSGNIYAADGETSLSQSVITISQKPIYSFYNPESNVNTAWGTESIEETGRLKVTGASLSKTYSNSNANGRQNTLNIIKSGLEWTEVLNVTASAVSTLKDPYNNIWYACLLRNRDLDGDNIVEENEIRWYLASVDQLTDLWIGQGSLNSTAWLYPQTLEDYGTARHHVASSSYYPAQKNEQGQIVTSQTPDNPWVIWGEEGASRGAYNSSQGNNGNGSTGSNSSTSLYYDYRCVRNLGLSLSDIDETPDDYVVVTQNTYNNGSQSYSEYVLDLSRLDNNSLRGAAYTDVEQPNHDERTGETNKPYKKIAVLRGVSGSGNMNTLYPTDDDAQDWFYYQENNVCPRGYRTPNQRELMLLYTTLNNENVSGYSMSWDGTYMTRTGFSFNGNSLYPPQSVTWSWRVNEGSYWRPDWKEYSASATMKTRPGFLYAGGNLILETATIQHEADGPDAWLKCNNVGKIRCVRDVTE